MSDSKAAANDRDYKAGANQSTAAEFQRKHRFFDRAKTASASDFWTRHELRVDVTQRRGSSPNLR